MTTRMSHRYPFLVTAAVVILALASTVFALQPALAAPAASRQAAQARTSTEHAQQLIPLNNNGNCPYNNGYSNCDGYDVHGSNCGWIDGSYGAYWVGNFQGDYSWLQVWWAPRCQTNFIFVNASNAGSLCGGQTCAYVADTHFERTDSRFTDAYCNANLTNDLLCQEWADNLCTSPGNCPTDTIIDYCAGMWNPPCDSTFNGEWIGTGGPGGGWWKTFVTDMLYAPGQSVQACVVLISTGGRTSSQLCSQWH